MLRIFSTAIAAIGLASCALPGVAPKVAQKTTPVVVDPGIELLSVIQLLSGYPLATPLEHSYKADAQAYFRPYAKHQAVVQFRRMWGKEFRFSEVPTAIHAFSAPPELIQKHTLQAGTMASAGGEAELRKLIGAMRDFYRVSKFGHFLQKHEPFYRATLQSARPTVEQVAARLESYTGTPLGDTVVVLGPLLHVGGFAASYDSGNSSPKVVAFIGPDSVVDNQPSFGSRQRIDSLITHEFAHTIINPLTEEYSSEVSNRSHLHAAIAAKMMENGYSTWEQAVYEHIIEAISARLVAEGQGEAAGDAAVEAFVKRGFVYVPKLVEKLKVYEANRARYPTISSFFPELLTAFA